MSSPTPLPARPWLWVVPLLAAVLVHAGGTRAPASWFDQPVVNRLGEVSDLAPRALFFESYLRSNRVDRGYRPLALASLVVENSAGAPHAMSAWINVLLLAGASGLVYRLLLRLGFGEGPALLAAVLFAVLPAHSDAVARVFGRGDLLATVFSLLALTAAMGKPAGPEIAFPPDRGAPPPDGLGGAALAGGWTLAALLSREHAALLLPVVALGMAVVFRGGVPWRALVAMTGAVLGAFIFQSVVLEGHASLAPPPHDPYRNVSLLSRALGALSLVGRQAVAAVVPLGLSAEYTTLDAPGPGWLSGALAAGTLVLLGAGGTLAVLRGRWAPVGLGCATFATLLLPVALDLDPQDQFRADRDVVLPALGLAIVAAQLLGGRARLPRRVALAACGVIVLAHGARTIARNEDWVSGEVARLVPERASPDWPARLFRGYVVEEPSLRSGERFQFVSFYETEARRLAQERPEDPWPRALLGVLDHVRGQNEVAVEGLTRAITGLSALSPPVVEPLLHRLRGDALVLLGRDQQAYPDLDLHIRSAQGGLCPPDAQTYSRRGLCLARAGKLREALADFDRALELNQELPELWNNRGFARYKLEDLEGAISDYKRGYSVCQDKNLIATASGDGMHPFLLRISDVYLALARRQQAQKDEEGARKAADQAAFYRREADRLVPPRAGG